MSSFFDDASLVTIPSGYKDGKVYSVKPTSGAGDLTFTRNSNATRVDADGLVEKVRTNSLLSSQQIDDPYWSSNRASISANTNDTLDPFGANNAEKITQLSGFTTAPNFNRGSIAGAGIYTASIFAKKGTFTFLGFAFDGVTYFDLDNGTIGTTASGHIAKIEDYGNGWYRCSVAKNLTASTAYAIYPCSTNGTLTTPDNEDYAYVFGAQLEQGLVATSYIETTTTAISEFAGVTASSVADVPRLDYSGGATCPSLLLEPQRSQLFTYSEYLNGWTAAGATLPTLTSNYATSPEGVSNAYRVQFANIPTDSLIFQLVSHTSGVAMTISGYVKSNTGSNQSFKLYGDYGTAGARSSVLTATSEWQRFTFTFTPTATGSRGAGMLSINNTASDLLVYGMQIEVGSYVSSYVPSYGTTVTRLADACSKTGISSLIGQTEGVLFVDFVPNNTPTAGVSQWLMFLGGGTNYISIYITNQKLVGNVADTTDQCSIPTSYNLVAGTRYKAALAYKANDFAFYVNGVQMGVDTSGTVPAVSTLKNNYTTSAANSTNAGLNQTILFTSRLSNADLANLTTL